MARGADLDLRAILSNHPQVGGPRLGLHDSLHMLHVGAVKSGMEPLWGAAGLSQPAGCLVNCA